MMVVTALKLRLEMPKPRRWLKGAGLAALLAVGLVNGQAAARGSTGSENPWAAEHVEGLPADIRRGITARERACGNKASARHYFSVSIEAEGRRFISLHFEDFACSNRAAVCNPEGCLHEVYLEGRGGHRLVFSARAQDVRMTNSGGVLRLEVTGHAAKRSLRWNGRRFVASSN